MEDRFANICINCFADKGLTANCPSCHFSEVGEVDRSVLHPRTLIRDRYLIGRQFEPGGFGITYRGLDLESGEIIAIKEYFPMDAADRAADGVKVQPRDAEIFAYGLTRFEDEAQRLKTLRGVEHVVDVRRFCEENATAYIIMQYYDGCNLSEYIKTHNGRLPESEVRVFAVKLARGLSEVHQHGLLHRDIKPKNIYITVDKTPILLDFGSARFAISERTETLSILYTQGFAPFEQYQSRGKQGPWTDIYGLSATLYYALTAVAPPQAPDRWENDELQPIRTLVPNISDSLEAAIHSGLGVRIHQRPKSIEKFIDILEPGPANIVEPPMPAGELNNSEKPQVSNIDFTVPQGTSRPVEKTRSPIVQLTPIGEILLAVLGMTIALVVMAMAFGLPVSILSILSYATLCYAIYLRWGDRKDVSFWALCIPVYNVRSWMRAGSNPGEPLSEAVSRLGDSVLAVHVIFDSGSWKGSGLELKNKPAIFGRDPSANLKLDTPEVSRRHVAVLLDRANADTIIVKDLGSRNGTFFAEASKHGAWSNWQQLSDELRIPVSARHRYRVRLGEDGDRFHFE